MKFENHEEVGFLYELCIIQILRTWRFFRFRSVSSEEHPRVQPILHSPLHSPVNIHFEIPKTTSLNLNTSPPPTRDYTDAGGSRTTSPRSINVIRRPSDVSNPRTRVTKIYLPQRAGTFSIYFIFFGNLL